MKKLLTIWTRGEKGRSRQTMISVGQVDVVSTKLIELQQCIPSCFARKPRSLRHLERWKATELRQFLVYTGKLVLSGILRQDLYEHFLTFSVAISILLCPSLVSQHVSYAHKLLQYFVAKGRELYGPSFLVYNVHSMLHLASDAKSYGCLDECSAFPFENYMEKLKKMVRSDCEKDQRKPRWHNLTKYSKRQCHFYKTARQLHYSGRWQMLRGHR